MNQDEFFQQHAVDGNIPEDRMAEFLLLEPGKGESTAQAGQSSGMPDADTDTDVDTEGKAGAGDSKVETTEASAGKDKVEGGQPSEQELNADNAVILSKSGKFTIEYSKLEEARTEAQTHKQRAEAAEAEAAQLRQRLEAAEAAKTQVQDAADQAAAAAGVAAGELNLDASKLLEGVDFGDYSDDAMARAMATMLAKATPLIAAHVAATAKPQAQASTEPAVDPAEAHRKAIYDAHPDAGEIYESAEFANWLKGQPGIARTAYLLALKEGTAAEVIEVFSTFNAATGRTGAADDGAKAAADAAAAAQRAVASAKAKPPSTLTDLPSGSTAHHNEQEALLAKSGTQAVDFFMGKDPGEIEKILARSL